MKCRITFFAIALSLFSTILSFGQTRDIGDFNAVSISTGLNVTLVQASNPSITYKMKKGIAKHLITEVKNGTLYVKTKSNNGNWENSTQADVTVYYTEIEKIMASAGCTVKTDGTVSSNEMKIEVSSGSSATLEVEARRVFVAVSSGSSLKLSGEATEGNFEASSGATLNAYQFETKDAVVEASSGASLSIHVDNSLDAEANSGASVKYSGNVKNANIDAGWSGSISRGK